MDKQQCLKHPHLNWKQNKALKLQVSTKAWFCQQCKISSKMHSSTKSKQAAHCHICRSGVLKIHSEQALLQGLFPKEKTATSFWENCRTSSSFEIPLHAFDGIGLQTRPHLLEIVLVQTHLLVICVLCLSKTFNYCFLLPVLFFRYLSSQRKLSERKTHHGTNIGDIYYYLLLCFSIISVLTIYCIHQSCRTSGSGSFRGERTYKRQKNFMECVQGHQLVRCPKRIFCVHKPSNVPSGGGVLVVASFVDVVVIWCDVVCCHVVGCKVMWGQAMWLIARCRVMSCDVMRCEGVWCDVVSFDVMWCNVVWCDEWCDAMWCDVL